MNVNYVHYSRRKTINLEEAASLLAHFELRGKNITDQDEYAQLFSEEKRLAKQVVSDANFSNALDCFREDGNPSDVIYYYNPEIIMVKVVDFFKWAHELNYSLPEELTVLYSLPENEVARTDQKIKGDNGTKAESKGKKTVVPATDNTKTVDGLLKMVIAMAMDCYGYDPEDRKSTTTADILKALDKCELSVSENTIRERLKQAQLLLPRDEKQQKTQ